VFFTLILKGLNMNKVIIASAFALFLAGCEDVKPSSDKVQREQQEAIAMQATMSVGMPAIVNFSEKRLLKDIFELRDKMVPTYTYLVGEQAGIIGEKICDSLGYGIPYATQFTNPQKIAAQAHQVGYAVLPQADPNGLFSPAQADGTWVMCKVPGSDKIMPQFIEPKIITLTFPKEARK
jgi:hypothetical protein